ncbi:MAG: hypothetical protein IPM84_03650, partial [Anaerolineae bacterium]|nr:hypothetical protein [Anaerolineae bacterium]
MTAPTMRFRLTQADACSAAMNTGTQLMSEVANMVNFDCNPTKLIEIVEIGRAVTDDAALHHVQHRQRRP